MDCVSIKNEELAERYLHNRLNDAEMETLETHLLECANCRREFELLQTVRADLSARAHEIRIWTPSKPFFLRWQTMSVAAVVVVVVAGAFFFPARKIEQGLTAQHVPSAANPNNSRTPEKPKQVTVEGTQTAGDSAKPGKVERDISPQIAHSPVSGPTVSGSRSNNSSIDVIPESHGANDGQVKPPTEVAQVKPDSSVPTKETQNKEFPVLTAEQGVEAYRLGVVEAAPFSFSGIGNRAADPKGGKSNTYGGKGGPSNTGRKLFSDGMNEYVQGHYHEATGFLLGALRYEPVASDVNFYLGVSRILDGHPEESEVPLQSVIAAGASLYLEPAHYYLGKAYVQQLKLSQAESEFQEAAKIPGRYATDSKAVLARVTTLREQLGQD